MKVTSPAPLLESLQSRDLVSGLTHEFYRYPARFHPRVARTIIEAFSRPGETVLDPFMGGGTSVVEALALGRKIIGVDINSLAGFVARVKTTPLTARQLETGRRKIVQIRAKRLDIRARIPVTSGQFKNTPWWLRNCIVGILAEIKRITDDEVERFLRCVLLRTAQWALDGKEHLPTTAQLLKRFEVNALRMISQLKQLTGVLREAGISSHELHRYRRLLTRSVIGLQEDTRIPKEWLPAKLVVTSPPYPGMHVLYHRWQVRGRRETPVPFAIAQSPDGKGSAYFTFGDRGRSESYFPGLAEAYKSIAHLLAPDALVVQLIAFSDLSSQLPLFLETMSSAGLSQVTPRELGIDSDRYLLRAVPNRKWYIRSGQTRTVGREMVVFHRPSRARSGRR